MQGGTTTLREIHDAINLKSLEGVKLENNLVLCRRIRDNIETPTKSGIYKANKAWHRDQYLPQNVERAFEVFLIPDKLTEEYGRWKTTVDVIPGDIAYVQYLDSLSSKVVYVKDQEYRLINYYDIITVKRGDKLIPLNGNVLFSRIKLEYETNLIVPDKLKNVDDPRYGIVEYLAPANEYYTKGEKSDLDKGVDIKKGDKVIFTYPAHKFAKKLEDPLHKTLDKQYYYCQRYRIAGKI